MEKSASAWVFFTTVPDSQRSSVAASVTAVGVPPGSIVYGVYDPPPAIAPVSDLESTIRQLYKEKNWAFDEGLAPFIPKRWVVYEPMVLFNAGTFDVAAWQHELDVIDRDLLFQRLLHTHFPRLTHIAINKPIDPHTVMRIPMNILGVHGDFGPSPTARSLESPTTADFTSAFWCTTTQNGIRQTWAPMYTMFSRGNIKEKKRLLDSYTALNHTWVVDLYAGIGYFSLCYARNGGRLMCWELNPWSVEALVRNCRLNNFSCKRDSMEYDPNTQVFVFNDTNEKCIETVTRLWNTPLPISHINLGLLPSSRQSWPIANRLLELSTLPTVVHVHENVHKNQLESTLESVADEFPFTRPLDTFLVKTFAPDVWHTVYDLQKEL
ncbi:S-adenosylmethionine-dependent methyltransferase [Yamadazyma tenuis]|uniref:tRNA wybutosine-synthesizing protein 2 n=1 Tax=Candida tenuis (strain ATCC 10573 / BCRC 21748 / CBS 615 / JCM 9827 / NBRC 10315 / NRRL Y-1498 / VKM Y-70) TaxID=590646 RepID=G3BBX2_CANTC|nr:uncharacterized protein CANTEDRAFT_126976 [Yamadazyma tenuis ATCC 10573]EGV60102.1 hypothetical protein CANTEDRAFT_126976 [Yamadazyma tenuis ATCC 10573]WEJ94664.1 S-adenosylmethionine-dependent methyltransferase [Yamadazyma tenuis]